MAWVEAKGPDASAVPSNGVAPTTTTPDNNAWIIPLPPGMVLDNTLAIDKCIEQVCAKLELPVLGGPSGAGWSMYSTAQKCPHLFHITYDKEDGREQRVPPIYLQIGGLYHALHALFYGYGLGGGQALVVERGLIAPHLQPREGSKKRKKDEGVLWVLPPDGADKLIQGLTAYEGTPGPAGAVIAEAMRLFDAHTEHYGSEFPEDVEPLAVEWWARHKATGYTCRYDMIGKMGPADPDVLSGKLKAGDIVAFERKTAAWLSAAVLDGWALEGEVLGEILCWKSSGCEKTFGPLAAVVVDIVTKSTTKKHPKPDFKRVIVDVETAQAKAHERGIRCTQAEIATWRAHNCFPQRFAACFDRWGKCGLYDACREGR